MYVCPKCGNENTEKERVNGMDTSDRICTECGYTGWKDSFLIQNDNGDDKQGNNNEA